MISYICVQRSGCVLPRQKYLALLSRWRLELFECPSYVLILDIIYLWAKKWLCVATTKIFSSSFRVELRTVRMSLVCILNIIYLWANKWLLTKQGYSKKKVQWNIETMYSYVHSQTFFIESNFGIEYFMSSWYAVKKLVKSNLNNNEMFVG